jgi:hypothetical protein
MHLHLNVKAISAVKKGREIEKQINIAKENSNERN